MRPTGCQSSLKPGSQSLDSMIPFLKPELHYETENIYKVSQRSKIFFNHFIISLGDKETDDAAEKDKKR